MRIFYQLANAFKTRPGNPPFFLGRTYSFPATPITMAFLPLTASSVGPSSVLLPWFTTFCYLFAAPGFHAAPLFTRTPLLPDLSSELFGAGAAVPEETAHTGLQPERCPLSAPPGLRLCLASLQRCSVKSWGMSERREGLQEVLSVPGNGVNLLFGRPQ